MEKYKFFEHTADMKFQAYGKNLEEAFSNAALAITDTVVEVGEVDSTIKKEIIIESEDKKALLYDFLEKFLYLMDAEYFVINNVTSLKIEKGAKFKLTANVVGDVGLEKYDFKRHVKAVTYNDMVIDEKPGNVMVQIVLDL
ncbi:MAG: archease [Nanoarchaeota archaeon]